MPLSWNDIRSNALKFSRDWAGETNERAEASTFWNEFLAVFGVPRRRVSVFEKHVTKAGGKAGFIDLFWPKVMIAEHKSLGKDLDRAFTQAIDYFPGLSDAELPRYVVVSDFAHFRVHDLETGEDTEVPLEDLHENVHVFSFIAGYQVRKFREQDPVNIKAADKLARLHDRLLEIGYGGHDLEVYLVRLLFCLFAEDTGIFMPRGLFYDFIEQRTSIDGSDLAARLNELFEVLNTPEEKRLKTLDEQLNSFPYINGGLFAERLATASFDRELRQLLLDCCDLDWGQVSPAIFGSLFQGIMDADMRRNLGAHYTSEQNIMKVIGPLFLDNLKEELAKCSKSRAKLEAFHNKLASLHFFDPACGCGNFLVITYREIRLLELEIIRRLHGKQRQALELLDVIDQYVKVNVDQFHGIEIEEWPAQIARVAMWLIDHQMNELVGEELGNTFVRIPLVKSANIVQGNALQLDWSEVIEPETCRYILGNPPFRGSTYQTKEQKTDLSAVLHGIRGAGKLDFVSGWFAKAVDYMQTSPRMEAALVSTNSITQGEQVGALWSALYPKGARINFAHRTFQWTNEAAGIAAVHCVIIGFSLTERPRKVLYEYQNARGEPLAIDAQHINPYLVDGPETFLTPRRQPLNPETDLMFAGGKPAEGGQLIFDDTEKQRIEAEDPIAARYIRPFMMGAEMINGVKRWCLWLVDVKPQDLRSSRELKQRVEAVRDKRLASTKAQTREDAKRAHEFQEVRDPKTAYLAIPKVSSERREYIPIGYFGSEVIAGDKLFLLPNATPYTFGVMCSLMHMAWTRSVCGRLKSDYSYSNTIIYNNFPWPQAGEAQRKKVETTSQAILEARANYPDATLADLYDPLSMPVDLRKAHEANDKAVDAAYGRRRFKAEAERVGYLFELYQKHIQEGA